MIVQSGCLVSEYGWEGKVPQPPSDDSAETILDVSFDHGAQRLFSSVRISVRCNPTVQAKALLEEWQFNLQPLSPSVTRVSSPPLGNAFDGPNAPSLPIFNAIFEIEQIPTGLDIWDVSSTSRESYGPMPSGQLTLIEDPQEEPRHVLFEINQPLTADMQNVSVSFTHSLLLYTPGARGSGRPLDGSFTVGRIVRVLPVVLPFNHKAILLPAEILLTIFENISDSPQVYKWWRRDLLSCALVCKQWTCALSLLLSDFRYPGACGQQDKYPPEICSFANALALRPSLGLSVTHLSPNYFVGHANWKDFHRQSILFQPGQSLSHVSQARLEQFVASFSSILRLAKNLRYLSLPSAWTADLPEELLDALQGLDKLKEVVVQGRFNTLHQTYLAMWPTLKRVTMELSSFNRQIEPIPTSPPEYVLTEATLLGIVGDEHLNYVLSSSSSSLERLTIYSVSLTNDGLHTALQGVAKSLVTLKINYRTSLRDENEERALDSLIVHMDRLKTLWIDLDLATHLMLKRRADAFERSRVLGSRAALPVIELMIDQGSYAPSPDHSLVVAAASVWPGWEINISKPALD